MDFGLNYFATDAQIVSIQSVSASSVSLIFSHRSHEFSQIRWLVNHKSIVPVLTILPRMHRLFLFSPYLRNLCAWVSC
jgi:hypothetical protein